MSCTSPSSLLKLTLLILTFIVSCAFVASVVWLLRTRGSAGQYESYYLSRINISTVKSQPEANSSTAPPVSDHYKDLVKIEIAMRRVEENSRRLKEYTKSLLWDNKDKSLWCVLFKDNERAMDKSVLQRERNKNVVNEEYIRMLREQKEGEAIIHLRHHGVHHRRRPDALPNMPYIK